MKFSSEVEPPQPMHGLEVPAEVIEGLCGGERPAGATLTYANLGEIELAQSNLSRALRAAFAQPGFRASLEDVDGAADLLAELEAAAHQVLVARKFYNTAVAVTRDARRKPLVRLLRLAGHAGRPEFFEMDDSLAVEDDDGAGADMQRLTG